MGEQLEFEFMSQQAVFDWHGQRKQQLLADLARHPFRAAWWLPGRHFQTCWAPLFRRVSPVPTWRERLTTPDGDFLDLHIQDGRADRPLVLLLHGLEGCHQSAYIQGMHHTFGNLGWAVATLEFRSCGGEINRAPRLYHSGETTDLTFAVRQLISGLPGVRLYVAGFSLGGNVLLKWLGEAPGAVPPQVRAAAAVCPPFDLPVAAAHLDGWPRRPYVYRFMRTLRQKGLAKAAQYPDRLDARAIRRARTFRDFDNVATAPLHGFRDADDYWARSSCGRYLEGIRRPTLLLAAQNDPLNPAHTLPHDVAEASPYLYPVFPERGGHVGFVGGPSPRRAHYWAEEQIMRFFQAWETEPEPSTPDE